MQCVLNAKSMPGCAANQRHNRLFCEGKLVVKFRDRHFGRSITEVDHKAGNFHQIRWLGSRVPEIAMWCCGSCGPRPLKCCQEQRDERSGRDLGIARHVVAAAIEADRLREVPIDLPQREYARLRHRDRQATLAQRARVAHLIGTAAAGCGRWPAQSRSAPARGLLAKWCGPADACRIARRIALPIRWCALRANATSRRLRRSAAATAGTRCLRRAASPVSASRALAARCPSSSPGLVASMVCVSNNVPPVPRGNPAAGTAASGRAWPAEPQRRPGELPGACLALQSAHS